MTSSDRTAVEEQVILVDSEDHPIGIAEKMHAHQTGLLHRAFSVCVLRQVQSEWEILLHQRAPTKYHSAGLWTNTCCSHPRPNEDVLTAAQRRLQEEMGFTLPLTAIGHFIYRAELDNHLIEHELDHILIGQFGTEIIAANPAEVIDFKWENLPKLTQKIQTSPHLYTAWLLPVLNGLNCFFSQPLRSDV